MESSSLPSSFMVLLAIVSLSVFPPLHYELLKAGPVRSLPVYI